MSCPICRLSRCECHIASRDDGFIMRCAIAVLPMMLEAAEVGDLYSEIAARAFEMAEAMEAERLRRSQKK